MEVRCRERKSTTHDDRRVRTNSEVDKKRINNVVVPSLEYVLQTF